MQGIGALRKLLRRRPIDWTRGAGRPPAMRPGSVAVIVPVYGAPALLQNCLASVARHTRLDQHELILVIDGPQDEAVDSVVTAFNAAHPAVRVLRNERRSGFVSSVNLGMVSTRSDVVLLNSDTTVTARWLEKLLDAASSSGDIGTVTPLSNLATLCSVPRPFVENLLPTGYDADSFAALVEKASARSYPRLPTGVGFCLYIRRALLDDIGTFDTRHFGLGYGEENDFSIRALARGWLHVADDATFIHHAGRGSFLASRITHQRRGARALARIHPRYRATIAAFMAQDPLAPARERVLSALAGPRRVGSAPLRVTHVVHGWPPFQHAGTELYAWWLVQRQLERHEVSVYTRASDPSRAEREAVELYDRGARVRLVTNNFTSRNPWHRNAIRNASLDSDFRGFLESERPRIIHVHHLAGHTFSLMRVAKSLGVPVVLQIQDWWFTCARVNRFDREGRRCSGPAPAKCAACATLTNLPPAFLSNRLMHAARAAAARDALRLADAFVAGSHSIRDDYRPFVPASTPFHVIPYGIAIDPAPRERFPLRRPVRFGYIGSMSPHKGVHVAVEAMRGIAASDATLHLWGETRDFQGCVSSMKHGPNVVFAGSFPEERKPEILAAMDVLLLPSIGLESFGLAAREAMACGVPVIASAGGALEEMYDSRIAGAFFPPGDAAALAAILRGVVADPSIVEEWARHLPTPKSAGAHAEEIEHVYRSVLESR